MSKEYGMGLLAGLDFRTLTYDDPNSFPQDTTLSGGSYGLIVWYGGLGLSVVRDLSFDATLVGFFLGIPMDYGSTDS